ERILAKWDRSGFSEIANRVRGQERHEAETVVDDSGHMHHGADAAAVGGGGRSYPAREQARKAADAGEADLHADVGDRSLAEREQALGLGQPRVDADLMRRRPEDGVELADEVIGREAQVVGDGANGRGLSAGVAEELACAAESGERRSADDHEDRGALWAGGCKMGRARPGTLLPGPRTSSPTSFAASSMVSRPTSRPFRSASSTIAPPRLPAARSPRGSPTWPSPTISSPTISRASGSWTTLRSYGSRRAARSRRARPTRRCAGSPPRPRTSPTSSATSSPSSRRSSRSSSGPTRTAARRSTA